MAPAKKLGDMLKESGLIDDFQLQSALSQQRNWGGKLGSILIDMGFVKEEDIAKIIAEKLKIPHVDLFNPPIPDTVLKLIKPDVAKKYHVLPLQKNKGMLVLAMTDPLDIEAVDAVRFITGLNVSPSLAMETEMKDAISKYYEGEDVNRSDAQTKFQRVHATAQGKMEIIHGSDLQMLPGAAPIEESQQAVQQEAPESQLINEIKVRFDALSTLLIEKKIITRDELVSMIYQKKMGL
jgi:type II secretion system (T2SS) protein E